MRSGATSRVPPPRQSGQSPCRAGGDPECAVGMRNREVDTVVSVSDRVELLVAVLNAEQNLGGIAFIRRRNLDGLETALQRPIFFNRLSILARRSRADTLNFTARQSRFQDVGRV